MTTMTPPPNSYDIFFFSLDEPYAEEHWKLLAERFPWAQRVHGVPNVARAWCQAAEMSRTEFFFSVDADNVIESDFAFTIEKGVRLDEQSVYVWRCRNAVNGLVYGNGAVKLWPKWKTLKHRNSSALDFTAEVAGRAYVIRHEVASSCVFHGSPYHAWKGGFRETYKLISGTTAQTPDPRSLERAIVWMNEGLEKENGIFCLLGATMGARHFFLDKERARTQLVNDASFLKSEFDRVQSDPEGFLSEYREVLPASWRRAHGEKI